MPTSMHSAPHHCGNCSGMWTSPTSVPSITIVTGAGPPGWYVSAMDRDGDRVCLVGAGSHHCEAHRPRALP